MQSHSHATQVSPPRPSTACNAATQTAHAVTPLAAASPSPPPPLSHHYHHLPTHGPHAPPSPPSARPRSTPPTVGTTPAPATTTTAVPAPVYFRSGVAAVLYDVLRRDVRKRAAEDDLALHSDATAPPLAPVHVAPIAAAAATSSTFTGLYSSAYRASGNDTAAAIAASAASGVVFDSEADAAAWAAYGPPAASGILAPSGSNSNPTPSMGMATSTGAGVTGVLRPGSSTAHTTTTAPTASTYLQRQSAPKRQRLSPPGPSNGAESYPWNHPAGGMDGARSAASGAAGGGLAPAAFTMRAHTAGLLGANPALARFAPPSMSSTLPLPTSSAAASLPPAALEAPLSVATGLASWGPDQVHRNHQHGWRQAGAGAGGGRTATASTLGGLEARIGDGVGAASGVASASALFGVGVPPLGSVHLGSSGEAFSEAVGGWLAARACAAVRAAASVTSSRSHGVMSGAGGGRGGAEHSVAAVSGVSYVGGGGGERVSGSVEVGGSAWAGARADTRALAPEELFGSYGKLGEVASMGAAWGAGPGPVGMDVGAGAEPWVGVVGGQRASGLVQEEEGGQLYGSPPLPRAPSVMLRRFLDQRSPA